jgi:hypothetical protein
MQPTIWIGGIASGFCFAFGMFLCAILVKALFHMGLFG